MPRLFVALDLPDQLKQELIRLQPVPQRGVRLTKPEQLHITLHFLGETELEPVTAALATVSSTAFSLRLEGVGRFANRRGPTILWAGIRPSAPLTALHSAIGNALRSTGYLPEDRPYSPHITLARCEPGTPKNIIQEFLERHIQWASPDVSVTEFALYSSRLTPQGSIYQRLKSFELAPPE